MSLCCPIYDGSLRSKREKHRMREPENQRKRSGERERENFFSDVKKKRKTQTFMR